MVHYKCFFLTSNRSYFNRCYSLYSSNQANVHIKQGKVIINTYEDGSFSYMWEPIIYKLNIMIFKEIHQ